MVDPKNRRPSPTTRLDNYVYRRKLETRDLIPAIGAGLVTGLAVFYVAKLFLERTPLLPEAQRTARQKSSGRATG